MWIRKTQSEIASAEEKKTRARFSPTVPLILSAFGTILLDLGMEFSLPKMAFTFVACFVVAYLTQQFTGSIFLIFPEFRIFPKNHDDTSICVVCHKVQVAADRCECGGGLEPFAHWKCADSSDTHERTKK